MDTQDYHPHIELPERVFPAAFDNVIQKEGQEAFEARKESHDDLLEYLLSRLKSDDGISGRRTRFASIDRLVSTWQKLSKEDSQRKAKQDSEGKAQAISTNLPVIMTHIDELTAFMADVYSPHTGSYFATPNTDTVTGLKILTERMNEDAAASGYYTHLTLAMRALLKYNIGGFTNDWIVEDISNDSADQADGMNYAQALDMYNTFWDPSVTNPSKIRLEGEWFAYAEIVNRMHLVRREQAGIYAGCSVALADNRDSNSFGSVGSYYRYPPIQAGVEAVDSTTSEFGGATVNWEEYGKSLGNSTATIKNGHEVVTMYCWLNPSDFDLSFIGESGDQVYAEDGYYLWKFKILAGTQIIMATPVNEASDDMKEQGKIVIPAYIGYLNLDDMLGANRSTAELLVGFQTFASFLMNAHVAGARGSIWGIKSYDPSMFNLDALDGTDGVSAYLASLQPGRDVRTGLQELKGTFDGGKTMEQIQGVMGLMQQLFPAQAMPSQVAGLDRAINSQVSALMQGVTRRLQMSVRLSDQSIFGPLRFDMYKNLVGIAKLNLSGLTDKQARKALGSGLEQLDREVAEESIRQLLFAMLQNPTIVEQYDVNQMLELWGSMLKTPVDVAKLRLQKNPPTAPAPVTPTEAAPGPGAIGMPV